jgi:hypothetical protein
VIDVPIQPADDGRTPVSDERPMGRIYVAVIVVEAIVLLFLWWLQHAFV